MFMCGTWNIVIEMKQHDGEDDEVGSVVNSLQRMPPWRRDKVDAGMLIKVTCPKQLENPRT
jgi:hypothetical protein